MTKKRAVVICPGRGSYAAGELGYLHRHHAAREDRIAALDAARGDRGAVPVSQLDRDETFSPARHLPGRNASNLIYTSALMDFAAIDTDLYEIVAVCGNSLGWYLTLACAGALSLQGGAMLVDTMGDLMEREGPGGQLLYSVSGEDWRIDPALRAGVLAAVEGIDNAYLSIDLSGTLVLAGDAGALSALKAALTRQFGDAPVQLPKHAAFHTPLLQDVASKARAMLDRAMFTQPEIPMIDGRGAIFSPRSTDCDALYDYTLDTQITRTYGFATSIEIAVKEFAPDCLILLGPGSSLGAPVAQTLIDHRWRGMSARADFQRQQQDAPYLLSMGREEQRALVTGRD